MKEDISSKEQNETKEQKESNTKEEQNPNLSPEQKDSPKNNNLSPEDLSKNNFSSKSGSESVSSDRKGEARNDSAAPDPQANLLDDLDTNININQELNINNAFNELNFFFSDIEKIKTDLDSLNNNSNDKILVYARKKGTTDWYAKNAAGSTPASKYGITFSSSPASISMDTSKAEYEVLLISTRDNLLSAQTSIFNLSKKGAICYIYDNGSWKEATPYIYYNGKWVEATGAIYDRTGWNP